MESIKATKEEIKHFLAIQQTYFDYGYCYDNDSGAGDGFSVGAGYYDCYGYGSDYGAGYDYCAGDGSGFSIGAGFDDCDGAAIGLGDIQVLNGNTVDYIDSVPTVIVQVHGNFAKGYIVENDLTLSPCYIAKIYNVFAHGKTLKDAVVDAKAKAMTKLSVKERIEKFVEAFGPLESEHTGKKFYYWHHILTGSCSMGRNEFCKDHDIDLEKKYTVKYFLQITMNAYGGDIIRKAIEHYERLNK